ncbi:MAG TPA: chromosomal replication initiator protein DnaA [Terriglobales bacterium]|nr:chromosomal replication initiator protein DnaA [Terriglobales bacterium]
MEAEWQAALPLLREQLGERNFATWIEPIRCHVDEQGLRLEVANRFFQEWITRHFLAAIRSAVQQGANAAVAIRVVVADAGAEKPRPSESTAAAIANLEAPKPPVVRALKIGRLMPGYTFDQFVVGPTNELAYGAARAVTESSGHQFNPLFLWGGVGLGKTHLISAVAHEALRQQPRRRIAFLSAESFINTLIGSLRQDQMALFRDRFRELDMLILDDVEFLAGKERTQEEFFHTFNALYEAGKQIVITSDKPPHAISELEQRLRSRFAGGLIVDIQPPTREMRIAIIEQKSAQEGVTLPLAVAEMIVDRSGTSVRELEGALTRILAWRALRGMTIDVGSIQRILGASSSHRHARVTIEQVQQAVSSFFQITPDDLKSHHRGKLVSEARQLAMYLSRELAQATFPAIGASFGGRDHSTVMYAVRAIERRRSVDSKIATTLSALEQAVRGGDTRALA